MILCYLQTDEYDLQANTYPTIWAHHKLHNNTENKTPVFTECISVHDIEPGTAKYLSICSDGDYHLCDRMLIPDRLCTDKNKLGCQLYCILRLCAEFCAKQWNI